MLKTKFGRSVLWATVARGWHFITEGYRVSDDTNCRSQCIKRGRIMGEGNAGESVNYSINICASRLASQLRRWRVSFNTISMITATVELVFPVMYAMTYPCLQH